MNILITGGAGFIGRSLQKKLSKKDNHVVLLDKKTLPSDLETKRVTYIQCDVCNLDKMLSIFVSYNFDGIIHLAAVSRVIEAQRNPEECKRTNIIGIRILLDCIENAKQKPWLIFGSSREVYGEPSHLPVKENAEKSPINIYGETKIKGESLFLDFSQKNKISCAVVRFSNVYGNRYDIFSRVVPLFIRAVFQGKMLTIEGGEQLIDFTHIDDSVTGVLKIINYLNQQKNPIQEEFHLCPGVGYSLQELIRIIEKTIGKKANTKTNLKRNYDVVRFVGNTEKVNKVLNLKNFICLEEGVRQSIDEYCQDLK